MSVVSLPGSPAAAVDGARRCWRAALVVAHIFYGLSLAAVVGAWRNPHRPAVRRLSRHWFRCLLRILSVEVRVEGALPTGTVFVVANHISWLDIPVLGSCHPVHFLSKAEVRDWPLIGALAEAAGTLFIRRGSGESSSKAGEIANHLRAGRDVLVFPEGTTTEGRQVRRFFHQLFRAPALAATPVQPVAIRYLDSAGNADTLPAFIGDDDFPSHLWRLLGQRRTLVRLAWLSPIAPALPPEALSQAARNAICAALD